MHANHHFGENNTTLFCTHADGGEHSSRLHPLRVRRRRKIIYIFDYANIRRRQQQFAWQTLQINIIVQEMLSFLCSYIHNA